MRLGARLVGAVLVIVLIASGAGAHLGAVEVETSHPDDTPTPACIPNCEVQSTSVANAPPVTVLASGQNLTWTEIEGSYHTATSDDGGQDKQTLIVNGEGTLGNPCLDAGVFDTSTVQFRIDADELQVFHWDKEDPEWRICNEAIGLGDGSFLLHYHCNVHPRFQNSAVLVVP